MYFIYVDEAGTSAKEPVTVVVGILIHADRHWKAAADLLSGLCDEFVPPDIREGFVFHAKQVWGGREYREIWPKQSRIDFIASVASIPRALHTAIAIGRVRRDADLVIPVTGLSAAEFQHVYAFWRCAARANKYVRDWALPNEVATMVAEDVRDMRDLLGSVLRAVPPEYELTPEYLDLTEAEKASGVVTQTHPGPIDKIIDTVHFVKKDKAPLLQIADACAFSFRRYFAEQQHGDEWVRAILGADLIWSEWQGATSEMTFSFDPDHAYPTRLVSS